eukprot:TRINITY_DN6972_c0_g2_i6.p1 TRINITY_DN6972_c0_g2~~TRINITY_DN6972_c0_g2_i6.p1  ORF type:complete len:482 (+),score=83.80 TRINITY_DN6972_c0_g2_i6:130-1575(+)
MTESLLSDNEQSLNINSTESLKIITLDEGFEMTRGNGSYQAIVFASTFLTAAMSMWYVYCIPFFLTFPRVHGCRNGLCQSAEEACASPTRYYEDRHYNLITEFDLLCEEGVTSLIPSSYPTGLLVGILFLSSAADVFGCLPVLLVGQCGMALSILVLVFFPSFNACLICTGACGFFSVASFFPTYSFAYGANHTDRVKFCASLIAIAGAVGEIVVALIMWGRVRWRTMCYVYMAACYSFVVFPLVLNETPRFFHTHGKHKSAVKEFIKIGKMNRQPIETRIVIKDEAATATEAISFCDKTKLLVSRQVFFKLLSCGIMFFGCGYLFYGISLNVQKFKGNPYLNTVLNGVTEIIAALLSFAFAMKIGLRKALVISFTVMTIGVVLEFISQWTVRAFVEIGLYITRLGVTTAFTLIYTLAGELFPSVIMSTCIGILGFCDRLGGMLSSPSMIVKNLFSIVSIVTGILSIIVSFVATRNVNNPT